RVVGWRARRFARTRPDASRIFPMAKTKAAHRAPTRKTKPSRTGARVAARAKTSARSVPRSKARPRGAQRFTVSHALETDFAGGLRRYAKYRDLGINAATDGMVQAHVIRFVPPCVPAEVSKLHFH